MMKKNILPVLLLAFICLLASCSGQVEQEKKQSEGALSDDEIVDMVVDNMMQLAKVPRPTHHEEKISNFLMDWAKEQGFDPVQDSVNNVIFDVPATEGLEDLPLTVLQGHMDMVAVAEKGKDFDPLNDPITVIRDDEKGTLTADGTSLGADDGIGDSIIMAAVQGKMDHGPLRIIITVNEEDGMKGAFNLDPKWLADAPYLINIDDEASDEVLVSTASGINVTVSKKVSFAAPSGDKAIKVSISHLKGGHSGMEIDKGRLNGIIGLGAFLKKLYKDEIPFELASFDGGRAANAIPHVADAVIVINSKDKDLIQQKLDEYTDELNEKYKDIEDNIQCEITEMDELPDVIPAKSAKRIIRFVTKITDGVYKMSADMKDLVETSSNLGVLKLNRDGISAISLIRSSNPEDEEKVVNIYKKLARKCVLDIDIASFADAWKYDPDSKLTALTKKVYKEQNGEDIKVVAAHAGLECGTFKKLNPDIDMISIGPDVVDVHTPDETLYIKSIPKTWHLLEGILTNLE